MKTPVFFLMIKMPFSKGAKDSTLDCALKFESTTAFETTPKR